MATAIGDLVATLRINDQHFIRGILRSQRALMEFGTTSTGTLSKFSASIRHAGGSFIRFGQIVKATAVTVVSSVASMMSSLLPLFSAFAFVGMARSGELFEREMRRSLAIMEKVSSAMRKEMVAAARAMADQTIFSVQEVSKAYYYLASAGMDARQSIEALPTVTAFAQAGNFDLATATSYLTDILSAFGLKTRDATQSMKNMLHISNLLVRATQLADATTEEFAEALSGKIIGYLKSYNRSLEEGVALLALLAERGIKGKEAGELGGILYRDIPRAVNAARHAWDYYRIAIVDVNDNMLPMVEIIRNLTKSLKPMSDLQRAAAVENMRLTRSVRDIIYRLLEGSEVMADFQAELKNVGGTMLNVAREQMTPFEKGWARITTGFAVAGKAIMLVVGPLVEVIGLFGTLLTFGDITSDIFDGLEGGLKDISNAYDNVADAAGRAAGAQIHQAEAMQRASVSMKEAKETADEFSKTEKDLSGAILDAMFAIKTFGMSTMQKQTEKFRAIGMDENDIQLYIEMMEKLELLKATKAKQQLAEGAARKAIDTKEMRAASAKAAADIIKRSLETPMESYTRQLREIARLQIVGALGKKMARRAELAALSEYEAATKGKTERIQDELPKVLERGSAEAWKKIVGAVYGKKQEKAADKTAKNTERTAKATEEIASRETAEWSMP